MSSYFRKAGANDDYRDERNDTKRCKLESFIFLIRFLHLFYNGSITSTEVYAKVALEKKIEAVNLFNGVFD